MTNDIRYAQDTSSWTDWQQAFRYGAFLLFPPPGTIEYLDDLRRRYDPESYATCQAHVTLSAPLRRRPTEHGLEHLRAAMRTVEPFTISFRNVHATPPYPGVVYEIDPRSTLAALRSTVHSVSLFDSSVLNPHDVSPHMTIAEFVTLEESIELAAELRGRVREGTWECTRIEYAVPDDAFRFQRVLEVALGP